jgi:glucosylglycerol-phosphate synthase
MSIGSSSFVILYHRTPFDESIDTEGNRTWVDQKSPNGIIPTLRNLFRSKEDGTWIAWRRVDRIEKAEDERIEMANPAPFTLCRIPLEDNQISSFYHVTSKECFWPILHTFPTHFNVNNADWSIFEEVNRRFAEAACNEAADGATIWVHDYNLWLVPGYIRSRRPDLKVAFFHHTPFPSNDVFAILPWREQILDSLLCCDVVGFHIPRYTENFARAASTLVGAKRGPKVPVDSKFITVGTALSEGTVTSYLEHNGRRIRLLSSPVGTSPDVIQELSWSASVESHGELIVQDTKKGRKLILSASRVDYTKGNEALLLTFERLLERREDLHGEVVLMLALRCGGEWNEDLRRHTAHH